MPIHPWLAPANAHLALSNGGRNFMAGKPRNTTWGGKRDNQTGRPRIVKTVSEKTKQSYIKAARELAKEKGMTIERLCYQ